MKTNPSSPQPLAPSIGSLQHAVALRQAGRNREAWEICRHLVAVGPRYDSRAIYLYGELSLRLGLFGDTGELMAELEKREPSARQALFLRLVVSAQSGDNARAHAAMERLLAQPADLFELEKIFELSGRTHEDIRRGLLLRRLLNALSVLSERASANLTPVLAARVLVALGEPRRALEVLGGITASRFTPMARLTAWMARRMQDESTYDFAAPKIFCIGLSKTGTTSLHKAFQLLGVPSAHWINPVTMGLINERDLLIFDALSDISVSYRFEHLYYAFPNARFIYSYRELAGWEKSFLSHYVRNGYGENFPDMRSKVWGSNRGRFGLPMATINRALYFNAPSPAAAYSSFDARVRAFFGNHPDRLLTLDIIAGDGWEALCPFIGKPIPSIPFPHANKTHARVS